MKIDTQDLSNKVEFDQQSPENCSSPASPPEPSTAAQSPTKTDRSLSALMRKSTLKVTVEQEKNHKLSYVYALLSAIFLGTANLLTVEISKVGLNGILSELLGILVPAVVYHIYKYGRWVYEGRKNDTYFCMANSMYCFEIEDSDDEESPADIEMEEIKSPSVNGSSFKYSEDKNQQDRPEAEGGQMTPSRLDRITVEPVIIDSNTKVMDPASPAPEFASPASFKSPEKFHIFSYERALCTLSRAVVQVLIQVTIIMTFEYALKTDVNPGIIASIFATNLLFTMVYFYFVYGQKLSLFDLFGTMLIIACIILVSCGGGSDSDSSSDGKVLTEEKRNEIAFNLGMAIVFAVLTGLVLSINTVSVQQCLRTGCDITQANYDGNAVMFVFILPAFLAVWFSEDNPMTYRELFYGTIVYLCITVGVVFLSLGLECGHAGPVQAIYGQSTTFQAVVTAIIIQKMPTIMQSSGVVCGTLGVIVIMCQSKDDDSKKEEEAEAQDKNSQANEESPAQDSI